MQKFVLILLACILLPIAIFSVVAMTTCGAFATRVAAVKSESVPTMLPPPAPAVEPVAPTDSTKTETSPDVEESRIAVASFKGDNLQYCVAVVVRITHASDVAEQVDSGADGGAAAFPRISGDQVAWMLFDEAMASAKGGQSLLKDARSGVDKLGAVTAFMSLLTTGEPVTATLDGGRPFAGITRAKQVATIELFKKIKWPGDNWSAEVKKGDLAKVDTCTFPNRSAVGTCRVEDSSLALSWSIVLDYFDAASTVRSDSGLKSCLAMGGKWSASTDQVR